MWNDVVNKYLSNQCNSDMVLALIKLFKKMQHTIIKIVEQFSQL